MVTLEQIKSNGRNTNSKLAGVRDNFVESMGKFSESLGLSRIAGQLYALLYISGGPISLDEMVEILKVSKGNVSINIRELEKWGAVKKVWVKGSRKDFYLPELDIWKIISERLKVGLERRLSEAKDGIAETEKVLEEAGSSLDGEESETLKIYKERIERVKELQKAAQGVVSAVSKLGSTSLLRKMMLRF